MVPCVDEERTRWPIRVLPERKKAVIDGRRSHRRESAGRQKPRRPRSANRSAVDGLQTILPLDIQTQPTDSSCGPTCLAAVYRYWDRPVDLMTLIASIGELVSGGTLAVHLGCDALRRGFSATITTFNLQVFDPTWFSDTGAVRPEICLADKLSLQRIRKSVDILVDRYRLDEATTAYLQFLALGGTIQMRTLDEGLVMETLEAGRPILCGVSATYLYQESRERPLPIMPSDSSPLQPRSVADDVAGQPAGHFVVVHGYDRAAGEVVIADPLHPNPLSPKQNYTAPFSRLVASILLGIVTYDANLLVIQPRSPGR